MRVFLVRHGQSNANVDWSQNTLHADASIALTDEGHEQARAAGKFLAEWYAKYAGRSYPKIRLWHSPFQGLIPVSPFMCPVASPHGAFEVWGTGVRLPHVFS